MNHDIVIEKAYSRIWDEVTRLPHDDVILLMKTVRGTNDPFSLRSAPRLNSWHIPACDALECVKDYVNEHAREELTDKLNIILDDKITTHLNYLKNRQTAIKLVSGNYAPDFVRTHIGPLPAWFPTSALHSDIREWDVSVAPQGTVLQLPLKPGATPAKPSRIRVSLYRILLEAGLAFTRGVGLPPLSASSLSALYRYIDLFVGTSPHLRMIGGIKDVDPRFKQLIAEEVSLGIACYILREHMEVVHISDFEPLLNPPVGFQPTVEFVPGHSDNKRPDFYCETIAGEVVLAESKGVVGPRFKMAGPLRNGKHQVSNVRPRTAVVRPNCGRVVIGTNLQVNVSGIRSDSMTHILDPEVKNRDILEPESDLAIRISYAKALRYIGLHKEADLLMARQQWKTVEEPTVTEWNRISLVPLGYAPIGGLVAIEKNVFETLRAGDTKELRRRITSHLSTFSSKRDSMPSDNGVIVLKNGIVVFIADNGDEQKGGIRFSMTPDPRAPWYVGTHIC